MENTFCADCGDILTVDPASTDTLYLLCERCNKKYKAVSNVLYEETFNLNDSQQPHILAYACDDITNERIEFKCPKCKKETIAVRLRDSSTMKATYICCKCNEYISY